MQTLARPVPKSWIIERYEKCDDLTEEMKERMTEFLLSLHGIKDSTKDDYLSKVRMLGIFLTKRGIMRFEDANSKDIDLFLARYDNEGTLNFYIHVFRTFYNFIKRPEVIQHLKLYKIELEQITPSEILTPHEVVKLAKTLHTRKDRNTFEKAEFYTRMVEIKEKGSGGAKKVEVAMDCQIDPNLLSQYLKINKLYRELSLLKVKKKIGESAIEHLSKWGINRLYALSRLIDHPKLLAKAISKIMATNREFSVDAIRNLVKGLLHGDEKGVTHHSRAIGGYSFALPLSIVDKIKDFIYRREDSQIHQKTYSDKEMVKRTALSLAKIGLETVKNNPNDFAEEYDTDKDGKVIFCGFTKIDKQPEKNLNALRMVDKENGDTKKVKLEIEPKQQKDEN